MLITESQLLKLIITLNDTAKMSEIEGFTMSHNLRMLLLNDIYVQQPKDLKEILGLVSLKEN